MARYSPGLRFLVLFAAVSVFGCASTEVTLDKSPRRWPLLVEFVTETEGEQARAHLDAAEIRHSLVQALNEKELFTAAVDSHSDAEEVMRADYRVTLRLKDLAVDEAWQARFGDPEVLGLPVGPLLIWFGTYIGAFFYDDRAYPIVGEAMLDIECLRDDPVGAHPDRPRRTVRIPLHSVEIDFFDRYRFDQFLGSFIWPTVYWGDDEEAIQSARAEAHKLLVQKIMRVVSLHDFSLGLGTIELVSPENHSLVSSSRPTVTFRVTANRALNEVAVRLRGEDVGRWNAFMLGEEFTTLPDGRIVYDLQVPLGPLKPGENLFQIVLDNQESRTFSLKYEGVEEDDPFYTPTVL